MAFFYGGLVRAKNVLGTMMQSFIALALVTVLWVLIGYTLAFGPDKAGLIGGLDFIGLRDVGALFAIITPALIAGAFAVAERVRADGARDGLHGLPGSTSMISATMPRHSLPWTTRILSPAALSKSRACLRVYLRFPAST